MKRRKSQEDRKETILRIRVTEAQKEVLSKAAEKVGLDLSSWVRFIAMKEAERLLRGS